MLKKYAMPCQMMFVLRKGEKEQWMPQDIVFSVTSLSVFSASGCRGRFSVGQCIKATKLLEI